ncbi:hypothetical protein TIFTF001_034253 [Ficus carica]|uniref:Uncharacterized protein n=1 Tax=Ficus carica TaxID=3494 RepID=A0AA88JAD8_FICCA|nr:hypothetical protein TIFTF001_034253 [Ficus carica]
MELKESNLVLRRDPREGSPEGGFLSASVVGWFMAGLGFATKPGFG